MSTIFDQHPELMARVIEGTKDRMEKGLTLHAASDQAADWDVMVSVKLARELAAYARLVILLELAEVGRVKVADSKVFLDGKEVRA